MRVTCALATCLFFSLTVFIWQANAQAPADLRPSPSPAQVLPQNRPEPVTLPSAQVPTMQLTIEQAVARAVERFPRVLQERELQAAARRGVTLQKYKEYIPYSPTTYQESFANHNRLSQTLLQDDALPNLSGGAPNQHSMEGRFHSATGFVMDWTGIDFGLHKARISESKAWYGNARSDLGLSEFESAENAAGAFLELILRHEEVRARQATVDRLVVFDTIAHSLVNAGLRAGAEASLADGQLAAARNALIRAQRDEKIANATLSYAIGEAGTIISVDRSPFVQKEEPPVIKIAVPDYLNHPLAKTSSSMIDVLNAQQNVLTKSYYPVLHLAGGMNFRGSGLNTLGSSWSQNASGIAPGVPNYLLAVVFDWDCLQWTKIRQEKKVQVHKINAERYHLEQIVQSLKTQDEQARVMVEAAVQLVENMPVQVAAAEQAELQSRTRYQTGLATVAEVAEAENLLAETKVQDAVARVGVWKALLAVSNSQGDIKPFLAQVAAARNGGGM